MRKDTAGQVIGAQMINATTGAAFTGPVTVYITGDGGTQAIGSVGSGICTHEGNGFHTYAPDQSETNYDHVAFTFVAAGALTATVQVYTNHPQSGDNYARLAEQVPDGPVVVIPDPGPGQTVAYALCLDPYGAVEPGVTVYIRQRAGGTAGYAYDAEPATGVSDGDGLAAIAIPRDAALQFEAWRGRESRTSKILFSGVDADTVAIGPLRGSP